MILKGKKQVAALHMGRRIALEVRKGAKAAWSLLSGLFSTRTWHRDKLWQKDTYWLTK